MLNQTTTTGGFTLVEVTIAMTIFMVAILGLGATSATMLRNVIELEEREVAIQVLDDRITSASMDPRYLALDSLYAGTDANVLGRFSRTTTLIRTQTAISGGSTLDYTTVRVVVSGGRLDTPLSRAITVTAP